MIRVRINKEIFIRKGPGASFPTLGTIKASGKVLEMSGWVEGESLKSNNKWYFNLNTKNQKQYYWGGGIIPLDVSAGNAPPNTATTPVLPGPSPSAGSFESKVRAFLEEGDFALHRGSSSFRDWSVSWGHVDLEIWKMWNHPKFPTKGDQVRIAVIDKGIPSRNSNLPIDNIEVFYPLHDGATFVDDSSDKHGCMCTGIVTANGPGVIGIAPNAKLLGARMYDKDGTLSLEALRDCLAWAINNNADIISLSFSISKLSDSQQSIAEKIREQLRLCKEKNIIVVCAIGNAGQLNSPNENVFPACEPQCIAIGGYDRITSKRFLTTTPSRRLKFLLPADNILTTTFSHADFIGKNSSISTPIFAGILGLFLSHKKAGKIQLSHDDILKRLQETGKKVTEQINGTTYEYCIPQPLNLLDTL